MEIHIHKSCGLRNDLTLVIPRAEIEEVRLHIANRDLLRSLPGLTRHREPTSEERKQNSTCKMTMEEHLTAMGLRDDSGKPLRRVIAIGNRDLGNNHGFVAWQRDLTPNLFHIQGDPLNYDAYSCLVAQRDGALSIRSLRFDHDTAPILHNTDGRDVADEIEWATFGQQILQSGKIVPIQEIMDRFSDIRHVLAYDRGTEKGREIETSIYKDYPTHFRENALRAWREKGVPRARYLHNAIGLSPESVFLLQREGTVEEVAFWLREAGAEDGLILDNGGSVACWAWWPYPNGGFLFAAPDYRPQGTSVIAFILNGPTHIDLPGGSVSYALV